MLVIVITTTIVIINRAKHYQRFTKCATGDKKESSRKHKEEIAEQETMRLSGRQR